MGSIRLIDGITTKRLRNVKSQPTVGIYLNGVNSYINCGNSSLFNSQNFAIEFDFTPLSVGTRQVLITKPTNNADNDLSLEYTGKLLWHYNQLHQDDLTSTTTLVAGTKYHIVITASSTNMYMYINGVLESSKSLVYTTRLTNTHDMYIGNSIYWGDMPLHAYLHFVGYYGVYWNSTTVAARYASLSVIPSNCAMFYNETNVANPIPDLSSSGNSGALINIIPNNIQRFRSIKSSDGTSWRGRI